MTVVHVLQYLVVANALLLVVQTLRVIAVYAAVYSLTKDERRQLPLHVWIMASSFFLYLAGTSYFMLTTPDVNAIPRTAIYGVAGILAQYGLWNVLQYDRRRYSAVTGFQDETVDELRSAHGRPR